MKTFNSLKEIEEAAPKVPANSEDSTAFIASCIPFITKQLVEIKTELARVANDIAKKDDESDKT